MARLIEGVELLVTKQRLDFLHARLRSYGFFKFVGKCIEIEGFRCFLKFLALRRPGFERLGGFQGREIDYAQHFPCMDMSCDQKLSIFSNFSLQKRDVLKKSHFFYYKWPEFEYPEDFKERGIDYAQYFHAWIWSVSKKLKFFSIFVTFHF